MMQWVYFIGFNAIMFCGLVLAASEICQPGKDVMTSMGGQFVLIAPVAILAPCTADCMFLGGALISFEYGPLGTGIFAVYYITYLTAGFCIGRKLAKKKQYKETTKIKAE